MFPFSTQSSLPDPLEGTLLERDSLFETRETVITHNGGNLHALSWGDPKNPSLLCLHGGGQSALEFHILGPLLASTHHVIALDYGGHGRTAWQYNQSPEYIKTQIDTILDHFQIKELSLFGSSLGGLHAAYYAHHNKGAVRHLILGDITPTLKTGVLARAEKYYTQLLTGEIASKKELLKIHTLIANSDEGKKTISATHLSNTYSIDDCFFGEFDPTLPEFINDASFEIFWSSFENIRCPTLLLLSKNYSFVPDASVEKLSSSMKQLLTKKIEGAGHNLVIDNPRVVGDSVKTFLAGEG